MLPIGRDSDLGCVRQGRYAAGVRDITRNQRHSSHRESALQEQQTHDTELEPVTYAMLEADRGLGMEDDLPSNVFYADGEEFLAHLESYTDSH